MKKQRRKDKKKRKIKEKGLVKQFSTGYARIAEEAQLRSM
jgi:hypothetical protein